MDEDNEALGTDPAAAFEALRAEVAALGASLDGEGRAVSDYAPTLGQMAAALAKIEAHPALKLTPEAFAYQVTQACAGAQQQGSRDLSAAIAQVDGVAAELARLAVHHRAGREQNRWLAIVAGIGAVFGVVIWLGLSGPIARALPAGWAVPERMAAATVGTDRWHAGAQMMASADPVGWNETVFAANLVGTVRNFVFGPGIMGKKEISHGPTQRAVDI
jgi:hypothetical protein